MSRIHIVRDYPYPLATVWRAVTDPKLIARWTTTGAGGRPEGFTTEAGTRFRIVAKTNPFWNGIVNCVVMQVNEPTLLRYTWHGDGDNYTTEVTYRLQPHQGGTRFTYDRATVTPTPDIRSERSGWVGTGLRPAGPGQCCAGTAVAAAVTAIDRLQPNAPRPGAGRLKAFCKPPLHSVPPKWTSLRRMLWRRSVAG